VTQQTCGPRADTLFQSVTVAVGLAIVCNVVAFGRGVFFARVLEPEELGTWALMANAVQVLAFVCTLGVPNGLARYSERHRREGALGSFYAGAAARTLAVAAVVCLAGFLFWQPAGQILFAESASRSVVWITFAAVFATVFLTLAQGMLHGLRLFRVNSLFDLGQNLAFLAFAILLLACWRNDAYAAAWANLAATAVGGVAMAWWLRRALRRGTDDRAAAGTATAHQAGADSAGVRWWPILAYSLGAWSCGSLQAVWRVLDRYMLLHLSSAGTSETLDHIGQYFIASKLGHPLSVVAGVLSMALLPHAVTLWESKRRGDVAHMVGITTKLAAISMTFAAAVLIVFKIPLIELVTGRTATLAAAIYTPVLVTVIAVSLHYILRTYLMCDERSWAITGVWLAVLAANAGLNAALIPGHGLMGATWATLISSGLAVALVAYLSARRGMPIGPRLVLALVLPAVLLLPVAAMLLALAGVAAAVLFTNLVLERNEKQWINQWCGERMGPYFAGRLGRIVAPRPS
jgi:O-antigen/teichoic acid export membrane protein